MPPAIRYKYSSEAWWIYDIVMRIGGRTIDGLKLTPLAFDNRLIRNTDNGVSLMRSLWPEWLSDAGEKSSKSMMEYTYWKLARRWLWFCLFDGKNPIVINKTYTWDELKQRFYAYYLNPSNDIFVHPLDWLVYFGRLGAMLYMTKPIELGSYVTAISTDIINRATNDMQEMFRPGKPPGFIDTVIITFIKVGTFYALTKGIGELAPDDSIIQEIATATTDAIEEVINVDNLVALAVDVASDTADDLLQPIRRTILDDIETLDDNTFLDLSAVSDQIGEVTTNLIKSVTNSIDSMDKTILDFINGRLESAIREVEPAEAQAAEVDKDKARLGGYSVAVGIAELLFKRKK